MKVCDKTCIFCFYPIINKYLFMAKRSLLTERPMYIASECGTENENLAVRVTDRKARVFIAVLCSGRHSTELHL